MNSRILLILHLLGAAVWVGGHLILLFRYLPQALKNKDPELILGFEKKYEVIGIPALLIQVITGIMMGFQYGIKFSEWFTFKDPLNNVFSLKLTLLLMILALALHARLKIIPKLTETNLPLLAKHIALVNVISLIMLMLGTYFRSGGITF